MRRKVQEFILHFSASPRDVYNAVIAFGKFSDTYRIDYTQPFDGENIRFLRRFLLTTVAYPIKVTKTLSGALATISVNNNFLLFGGAVEEESVNQLHIQLASFLDREVGKPVGQDKSVYAIHLQNDTVAHSMKQLIAGEVMNAEQALAAFQAIREEVLRADKARFFDADRKKNAIDADDIVLLRRMIFSARGDMGNALSEYEVGFLFSLAKATDAEQNCAEWPEFFNSIVAAFLLDLEQTPERIDIAEAAWLKSQLSAPNQLTRLEKGLLRFLAQHSGYIDVTLQPYLASANAA
jgi:hypothetical protein